MRAPRLFITSALEAVDAFVRSESPVERAYAGLQDDVARFTQNHLSGCPRAASAREDLTHALIFNVYCPETDQAGTRRCDNSVDISHKNPLIRSR